MKTVPSPTLIQTPCGQNLSWPVWPLLKVLHGLLSKVRPHLCEVRTEVGRGPRAVPVLTTRETGRWASRTHDSPRKYPEAWKTEYQHDEPKIGPWSWQGML